MTQKYPSEATGDSQTRSADVGRGVVPARPNEHALRAMTAHLNDAIRVVELEDAETLNAALSLAEAWLKELKRKAKAARS